MKNLFIYLSGTIRKSHDTDCLSEWTPSHLELIRDFLHPQGICPFFLNPTVRSDDLSDEFSLFGRDLLQVYLSDFVLADMEIQKILLDRSSRFAQKWLEVVYLQPELDYTRTHPTSQPARHVYLDEQRREMEAQIRALSWELCC